MWWRILTFLIVLGAAGSPPALAQTQAPPADYWYGPWFMGGGWTSFWWICPLMMLVMMAVMMFACRFMCGWHRE